MAGDVADLGFIDTPYNCDYSGYTEEHLTIQNDRMSDTEFKQFLEAVFRSCRAANKPGASSTCAIFLLATRVSERAGGRGFRGPLPDHLGQEHIRLGLRPL